MKSQSRVEDFQTYIYFSLLTVETKLKMELIVLPFQQVLTIFVAGFFAPVFEKHFYPKPT